MKIGGFQKYSLIDYPGKVCAIVFTVGCDFRCPFCHNSELVIGKPKKIPLEIIFDYLEKNNNLLDAVEITGGEPTLQSDLKTFVKKIKELGLLVKIDTNGTRSSIIKELIDGKLVDYIAMDVKAPLEFEKYNKVVGNVLTEELFENVKKTIEIIMGSKIDYEFRTTVVPALHSDEDMISIARSIKGAKRYVLQQFIPRNALDPSFLKLKPLSKEKLGELKKKCEEFVEKVEIRYEE